ncbi:hypothetical protein EDB87DRAFT_1688666 [Lactarius vividus]|nr:hypothetical protein EDB87DRAFT_1688666 [Lactarius vividus]
MRASCIAVLVLAAAAAPALSAPVLPGLGSKLFGSHRGANKPIGRNDDDVGVAPPDHTLPLHTFGKRFTDGLSNRDDDGDNGVPPSQVNGRDEDTGVPPSNLNGRDDEAGLPPSKHHPRFTDKLFGRDKEITARDD